MRSVIVIPTYNEAENLGRLTARLRESAPDADLLIVDDNSPDHTADLAEALFREHGYGDRAHVIRRSGPRGLGRAYRNGFAAALEAGYDFILQMDADLSHEPAYLPEIRKAAERNDLVIGSRYCPGGGVMNWPWRRRTLSRFANRYVRWVTRIPFRDATAGYRCWSRDGLRRVEIETVRSEGYSFQVEMSYRAAIAGLRCTEVPIIFTDRRDGQSKISRKVLFESMVRPWTLRLGSLRWVPAVPAEEVDVVTTSP